MQRFACFAQLVAVAAAVSCNVDGFIGDCKDVSLCSYTTVSGLCPGASNIKCCINYWGSCGDGKHCKTASTCVGTTQSGLCPGDSTVKCCTPSSCSSGGSSGSCVDVNEQTCSGSLMTGLCPGASNIKCCLQTPAPTPSPPVDSCTTTINSYSGTCKSVSQCTGATFNGLCSGSSSIKCCVPDPNAAPTPTQHVTLAQFMSVFESVSSTRATAMLPYFNKAMETLLSGASSATIKCRRIATFSAQVGHESTGLLYFEELASGAAYEGRTDLGNTQTGDGKRFKGRGPIQLTGRYNYQSAGTALGLALTTNPESVCYPSVGFATTVWFWTSHNLNTYADTGKSTDFISMTEAINGGRNGLADRESRWAAAKTTLGC
ncbi:chitinase [Diplonema papillatum]|nr:chitinase [Diplonema papillatum]